MRLDEIWLFHRCFDLLHGEAKDERKRAGGLERGKTVVPYILLIGTGLAGGPLLAKRPGTRRAYLLASGMACWLVASLRYVTGFDYRSYEDIFQGIAAGGLAEAGRIESGFAVLNWAVARLGGDYRVFLFVFHLLLTALVFAWIGRYSPLPWLSVYLFLTLPYFAMSMNLLRQALAAAIGLWAYPFLKARRFPPYCGVVLLASLFHRTVLIMLPLYFLLNLRVSKRHYGAAALLAGAAYFLADPLMQVFFSAFPRYESYTASRYWQGNGFRYLLFPLGLALFAVPLMRRAARSPGESPVLANSMFYSLLMQVFITQHFILERLSVYVAVFSLLALPEAARLPGRRFSPKARTALLLAWTFAYFLFAAWDGFHGAYPYHGVWSRALSP